MCNVLSFRLGEIDCNHLKDGVELDELASVRDEELMLRLQCSWSGCMAGCMGGRAVTGRRLMYSIRRRVATSL